MNAFIRRCALFCTSLMIVFFSSLSCASLNEAPNITTLDPSTSVTTPSGSFPNKVTSSQFGLNTPVSFGLQYIQGTGVVLDAQINKKFNKHWAASLLGQYGSNLYRVNGTVGTLIGTNNLFKVTLERLSEVMPFQFDSGNVNQRVNQNAAGARYQVGIESALIQAVNAGVYYAKANNVNLSTLSYLSNGLSYTNYRNIAGGTSDGGDVGVISTLGSSTQIDTHLYYDQVNYDTIYTNSSQYNQAGLGVSAGLAQIITPRLKLIMNAEYRKIYDSYQASLAYIPPFLRKYDGQIALTFGYFVPSNNMPNSKNIGVSFGFNLEKEINATDAHYVLNNPNQPDLQEWTSTPAVYMEQVLAVGEQRTVLTAPHISAISPPAGSAGGGTSVVISGAGFTGAAAVNFGVNPATSFTVNNDSTITAMTPSGTLGTSVNVSVTTPGGTDTLVNGYSYNMASGHHMLGSPPAPPVVTSVSPSSGIAGDSVTITGTGFSGINPTQAVTFGTGNHSSNYTVFSDTLLTNVIVPTGSGTVDVVVTNSSDQSSAINPATDQFTYGSGASPTITSVSPSAGPATGGTLVTINGTNFVDDGFTTVSFGGSGGSGVSIVSSTQLTVTAPVHSAGVVNVVVETTYGSATSSAAYTYDTTPTITSVSPNAGSTAGGTNVTITGAGFATASAVGFGSTSVGSFTVVSDSQITTKSPAGSAGVVDVHVANTSGSSPTSSADHFTYDDTPVLISLSSTSGPTAGGSNVTLTGTGFTGATSVTFGGTVIPSSSFVSSSSTTIVVAIPADSAGSVSVGVTTPGGTSTLSNAYTYVSAPVLASLSSTSGPLAGGSNVTLTGSLFSGATSVNFGSTVIPSSSFVSSSSTTIVVAIPADSAGSVSVGVTTPGGTSTLSNAYTYVSAPVLASLSSTSGPLAGGSNVTLTGSLFSGATSVNFGSTVIPSSSFVSSSSTTIVVAIPAGSAGSVSVGVTTPGGTSTLSNAYTYVSAPVLASLSSTEGPVAGGSNVTLSGSLFSGATSVSFGGTVIPSSSFVSSSSTTIVVAIPAGSAGSVSVGVTTPGGTSTLSNAYTYVSAPVLASLSSTSGPLAGGSNVTLTGSLFSGATSVSFGGTVIPSSGFVSSSSTTIVVVIPAGLAGSVSVGVTTPGGISTIMNAYTYVNAPVLASLSSTSGPLAGGSNVTLTGSLFSGATSVSFGGTVIPSSSFVSSSSTTIVVAIPAGSAGSVSVGVTTPGGTSTLSNAYTYDAVPTVTNLNITTGPASGNTTVNITGTNFTSDAAVKFGTSDGTSVVVNSSTSITAISPSGSAGTINVTVTTPGGTSATSSSNQFTYVGTPSITSISPPSSGIAGGQAVTVHGSGFTGTSLVTFGGSNGTSIAVQSDTQLTVLTPAHAAGLVNVIVTSTGGVSLGHSFTYSDTLPVVGSVSPANGSTAGGASVIIQGANFTAAPVSAVQFGAVNASSFTVNSDTQITAIVPPNSAGVVDITVSNINGTSSTSSADQFTYSIPVAVSSYALTSSGSNNNATMFNNNLSNSISNSFGLSPINHSEVRSLTPAQVSTQGGDTVILKGTNMNEVKAIYLGHTKIKNFTHVNNTTIKFVAPAHSAGHLNVKIKTANGTSKLKKGFSYH